MTDQKNSEFKEETPMSLQQFLDRMNQLPPEVKSLQVGFFDFGYESIEWLDHYLKIEAWKNWSGEKDNTFVIC